jgi:hypothetical protein
MASPAIGGDGTVYIGSGDDSVYAINPDGTKKWSFATGSEVYSSPAIAADGTVYVGSYDGNLYAFADVANPGDASVGEGGSDGGPQDAGAQDDASDFDASTGAVAACLDTRELGATGPSCDTCALAACGSQESAVATQCPAYLGCLCSNPPPSSSGACGPDLQGACAAAVESYNACTSSNCAAVCGP